MTRRVVVAAAVATAVGLAVVFVYVTPHRVGVDLRGWFGVTLNKGGTSTESYQALSGFVPALAVLSLASGAVGLFRAHNCHQRGCLRLAHHIAPGGYRLCKRHVALPAEELNIHVIHEDHR